MERLSPKGPENRNKEHAEEAFLDGGTCPENMKAITRDSMTLVLTIAGLLLLWSTPAFVHGNEKHVIGTVKNVAGHTITVTTKGSKTQEVRVTGATLFERSGHTPTLHDLTAGDRAVIHGVKSVILEVHTVRIGPRKGKKL